MPYKYGSDAPREKLVKASARFLKDPRKLAALGLEHDAGDRRRW